MSLVRTNGISTIVAREHETINAPCRQDTLLIGPSPTQKGRYKSKKGWPRLRAFWKAEIPSFAAVVVPWSLCRRPQATVILDFESDGGMLTMNPYGDMFCHIFGRLFYMWS